MNLFKSKLKSNNKVVLNKKSVLREIGRDPYVDWFLIVFSCFIISVTLASLGVWKYYHTQSRINIKTTQSKSIDQNAVNSKSLDTIISMFEERLQIRNELLKRYSGPKNPAI